MADRIVVYTAVFGAINDLVCPPVWRSRSVEFHTFLDETRYDLWSDRESNHGWHVHRPKYLCDDVRRQARAHKCLSHELFPDADVTLWIDGCLRLCQPVEELISGLLHAEDLCVFTHQERSCLYDELTACIEMRKDDPAVMERQVNRMRSSGYPQNKGLAETTAVLRRHTPEINEFNRRWWEIVGTESLRDQLSFDFVCWQMGLDYSTLGFRVGRCIL